MLEGYVLSPPCADVAGSLVVGRKFTGVWPLAKVPQQV
jgi:hypothetical protein